MFTRAEAGAVGAAEVTRRALRRSIFNLVWPTTVESALQMGVGLINTAMVGHLSAVAIAAVGLCSRATMVGFALSQGVSIGVTVLVAQSIGSGNTEQARRSAVQGIMFGGFSSLILGAAFAALATLLLGIFRPEPDLLESAATYLRIVVIGMPAQGVMLASGAAMRGSGNTRTPMLVAVFVNLVCIAASYGLIYGNMGLPALGLRGAAIATAIAQWTGAVLALIALTTRNPVLNLPLRGPWRIRRAELRRILAMGLPATGESLFWQSAQIILVFFITGFGTKALAAHQLGFQAESLSYMPTSGFTIAATTLVGQAVGAHNPHLARRATRELALIATTITMFTGGLLFFFPKQILTALTEDVVVISLGAVYLRLMATAQIPQQLTGVFSGSFRGRGDTRTPMLIAATGLWGIRLPLAYILAFPCRMGIIGVWTAMTFDLFVRFTLMVIRYRGSRIAIEGHRRGTVTG